ncbi:MAG: PEGA domain-containing protein [Rectinemataceae bacterium]
MRPLLLLGLGIVLAIPQPASSAQTLPNGTVGASSSQSATSSPSTNVSAGAGAIAAAAPASWVVGFARFSAESPDSDLASLRTVMPLLIAADLGSLPPHHSSEAEREAAAARTREKDRFAAGGELYARLDDRALHFLDPASSRAQRTADLLISDQNVAKAREKLASELSSPPGSSSSKEETTLPSALWDGNARGDLIDPASGLPSSIAASKKIDLLVFGTLRDLSGYVEVSLRGYDASLGTDVFAWKGFCAPEDPSPLARSFARKIEESLAGRAFARLLVDATPDSARISVDGAYLSQGERTIYRFSSGPVKLRVEAPGFVPIESVIDLNLGEWKRVDVRLDPEKTGTAIVSVSPPSAQISLDSLPKGTGPLDVDLNGTRIIASASAPGYEPGTTTLPKSGTADVNIVLRPSDGLGPGGRVDKAKDSFYGSLGWFVLSVPVTALTVGLENGYAEAAIRSGDPQLVSNAQNSQIALEAAIGVSVVLAINAIIHLVRYLDSTR